MEELEMNECIWCLELCKFNFAMWLWACAWPFGALVDPKVVLYEFLVLNLCLFPGKHRQDKTHLQLNNSLFSNMEGKVTVAQLQQPLKLEVVLVCFQAKEAAGCSPPP